MKQVAIAFGLFSLVSSALASCAAPPQNTQSSNNRDTNVSSVAVTLRDLGNPFFVQVGKGAQAEAKKLGGGNARTTIVSSGDDLNQQFNQIENFIASKVSMIIDKSRILVMDEPTAALSDRETEKLFEVVRRLRNEGIAIIYISHRMEEIYALADKVSVIRDGGYIGSLEKSEISAARLVEMMVGRSLQDLYEHKRQTTPGPVVLEVTNLSDGRKVKPASFQLHAGEIVGLAGLVGAGRTELARLIFGADRKTSGEIKLEGRRVNIAEPTNAIASGIAYVPEDIKDKRPLNILTPDDAIDAGIAYVPEDRKNLGLFLEMSSGENITLNVLGREAKAGIINSKSLFRIVAEAVKNLGIRLASPSIRAMDLSGGNQQKLLLARWLAINPNVLLLDEPTRGVDIGAKSEIYRIISDLAINGVAILMISSELPEIVGMSDRLLVMRAGSLVGEVGGSTGEAITQENIMAYATGAREVAKS